MGTHFRGPGDDPVGRIFRRVRWPKGAPDDPTGHGQGGRFAEADSSFGTLDESDADAEAERFRDELRRELDSQITGEEVAAYREVDRGLLATERGRPRGTPRTRDRFGGKHVGDERFEGRRAYFAYGINADKGSMTERTGAVPHGPGVLHGHKFEFRGGVANVEPDDKSAVKGSLWMVDEDDLASLDGFEGYPWAYGRKRIVVDTPDGPVEAYIYTMDPDQAARRPLARPRHDYVQGIRSGRRRLGQPKGDIDEALDRVQPNAPKRQLPKKQPKVPKRARAKRSAPKRKKNTPGIHNATLDELKAVRRRWEARLGGSKNGFAIRALEVIDAELVSRGEVSLSAEQARDPEMLALLDVAQLLALRDLWREKRRGMSGPPRGKADIVVQEIGREIYRRQYGTDEGRIEKVHYKVEKGSYARCPHCDGDGCEKCKEEPGPPGVVKKSDEPMQKVETFSKPGTADVTPSDREKLAPLLRHYAAKAHPFTSCYRDQVKHGLSPDHAKRRCAVLKDLIVGNTYWRGKGKGKVTKAKLDIGPSDGTWTEELGEALDRLGEERATARAETIAKAVAQSI